MAGEIELQHLCARAAETFLSESGHCDIQVGERIHIIKDCTFVPENDDFTLLLGHAQADVAIFIESEELTGQVEESRNLKLYMNAENVFRVPLAVLEVKRGSMTTDAIRSRDIIAREMNEIFPFMGYFFVADEVGRVMPRKIYRAGKHFDSFFLRRETADREWVDENVVREGLAPHFEKLANLEVLS